METGNMPQHLQRWPKTQTCARRSAAETVLLTSQPQRLQGNVDPGLLGVAGARSFILRGSPRL